VQFQSEAPQSLAEFLAKLRGIDMEPDNEVVGPSHDDYIAACVPLPPLLDP
jgi:hypothetical protein